MHEWLRWFLPLYMILFFAVILLGRAFLVWRATGINAYALGGDGGVDGVIERLFRWIPLLTFLVVLVYALAPDWYFYLTPIVWMETGRLRWLGVALLVLTFVWVVVAQRQMGLSWRIGIDRKYATELVRHGVFRFSRNPIFLGLRVSMLGMFLTLPNAATLALAVLTDALLQVQARLEEQHLLERHRQAYRAYCGSVRRWI